ncbi:Pkinase-domain-containing protein [Hypoxylon sp. FL0890]|nr:Pkinase-domain-containing protein [Hypoxylon sp. FL0890]
MPSLTSEMADRRGAPPRPSRTPLGDATARVLNTPSTRPGKASHSQTAQPNPLRAHPTNQATRQHTNSRTSAPTKFQKPRARSNPHTSVASQDVQQEDKRESQVSIASFLPSGIRKTHIGPWELGKTLGCGSAARVRLVRHKNTAELAAVKILSRNGISNTQPASIANLDKWDRTRIEYKSENRMPINIEREVAIMKLIDHPNIVKLYDIWESRSEIYLVLEYVEKGDLYHYIAQKTLLSELESIFFFRQLLSALEYIHSFNICHRDLKPENILLTEHNQVKIIDFGMSAMHQGPQHILVTACGSPHYAAPELIAKRGYRAETVDIWSLGVITYACMTGRLPFDGDSQSEVLHRIERGVYHLPEFLSYEAQDLISRILVVNPKARLSSREIWQHPLIRMYDHMDHLNVEGAHDYDHNTRCDPVPEDEVDKDTLRQLKAVWHTYNEGQIARALTSDEPNDFKMFYWLINGYKERVLENYGTDLTHSPSDFHHLRAPNWKKRYTTVEFPAKNGRSMSRFTLISNVATDENGEVLERASVDGAATVQSYDPYKASQVIGEVVASHAKIIVHRNGTTSTRNSARPPSRASTRTRNASVRTNSSTRSRPPRSGRQTSTSATLRKSRQSLRSIKSGEEVSYERPVLRHKRGVDFSLARKRLVVPGESGCRPASVAEGHTDYNRNFSCPTSPGKRSKLSKRSGRARSGTQSMADPSHVEDGDLHWNQALRQWSHTIAKDCDDAFNSSLLDDADGSYLTDTPLQLPITEDTAIPSVDTNTPTSIATATPAATVQRVGQPNITVHPWDSRPLPLAPSSNGSDMHEYLTAKTRAGRLGDPRPESPGFANENVSQLNRRGQPASSSEKAETERRVVSAPIYSQFSTQWGRDKILLPSINEGSRDGEHHDDEDKFRSVSLPEPSMAPQTPENGGAGLEHLAQRKKTIRLVDSESRQSGTAMTPATCSVRKDQSLSIWPSLQGRQGPNLHQQYVANELKHQVPKEPFGKTGESLIPVVKKKPSSWFKRNSKEKDDLLDGSSLSKTDELERMTTNSSAGPAKQPTKKKSFGFGWLRGNKERPQYNLSLGDPDCDEYSPERARASSQSSHLPYSKDWDDKVATRNIEPQRSWLARLFRVKPATRYLCFSMSRPRVRQEITYLLREWKSYGIKDIVVDKDRSLVFARVAKKNHLNLKEASFAAEIMTVVEHGRRNQLSVVRFTQERGAASTFHKVIDTMDSIFGGRNLLVADKQKAKIMVKMLNL